MNKDNQILREEVINNIISEAKKNPEISKEDFHKVKNKIYKEYKINKPIPSIEILDMYEGQIARGDTVEDWRIKRLFRKRWVRSLSGVTVISLLTKFWGCPWKCVYCPTYPGLPKSYITDEPAVARAELNKFDPILQIHNRLRALEVTGHKIEKNDIRIIGWTWSFYPKEYQEEFIKSIYDAFNTYDEMKNAIEDTDLSNEKFASFKLKAGYWLKRAQTIEEAKEKNKEAKCRVIGIAIETRPDWINEEEIKRLRSYGVTRVEIWYQSTFDEINELNKRGHGNKESIEATKLLKDAWFKVVAHMMPNLLGSTPDKDRESLKKVFEDSNFRPDELKIYPMVVTPNSELTDIWKDGWFKAYDDQTLIDLTCDLEEMIPEYVRINRTYRDIPATEILEGSIVSNLRQVVEQKMEKEGRKIMDIRSREIKDKKNDPTKAVLRTYEYEASGGKEYFLTFECPDDRTIFSLLRLRIPSQIFTWEKHFMEELQDAALIREVHTFGDQLSIWEKGNNFGQHIGFGKRLIAEAERIAKENHNLDKMCVISGVWVRAYYQKRGYESTWEYMTKKWL